MDLKTKFWLRALLGFSLGVIVGVFMLVLSTSDELLLNKAFVAAHILCSGLMGFVGNGGAIVYDFESWGIIKATFVHYTITFMTMMAISEVLGWFPHEILIYVFLGFTFVYLIIWIVEYQIGKKQVAEMNRDLKSMLQNGG